MSAPDLLLEFCRQAIPPLERGDTPALLETLEDWPAERLLEALSAGASDSEALAVAQCLGAVGGTPAACALVSMLGHPSAEVAQVAEDALWSVWMRAAPPRAVEQLRQAIRCSDEEDFAGAIRILRLLVAHEPAFAEAHHQLALALHARESLEEAESAYREAVRLNPLHFAAFAGLGHIAVARADLEGALARYRRAVHLHPRLGDIRELLPRLEAAVQRRVVA